MSRASRAYCERRIDAIERQIAERRPYVGLIWPDEHGEAWGGALFRAPDVKPENVDDLLELRAKWNQLLAGQRS